jgi:RNA polymerase sigma-70 factor (ECF subfamily)
VQPDENDADSDCSLAALVQRMGDGDRAAFSAVYAKTAMRIFSICRVVLGSKEDAEEIVCDVFTYAWRHAADYDATRGSVVAWLGILAKNRSIDRYRRRRDSVPLDEHCLKNLEVSSTDIDFDPEQLLVRLQAGSAVHRALQSLPLQRRRLLDLAFFQGLTHQEISDTINMPLGTVKSHLRRALAALHSALPGGCD